MAKTYRRADGFEVHDGKERGAKYISSIYGGEFIEVLPPTPPTKEELAKQAEIAEKKDALAKSDYKILKKLEKLLPADDVDVLERQGKRNRINELEAL